MAITGGGPELEMSVLGALIIEPSRFAEVDIDADDFTTETNQEIYRAIVEMNLANEIIDTMTVADWLGRATSKNWLSIIGAIVFNTPTAANVRTYAAIVKRTSNQRRACQVAQRLMDNIKTEGSIDNAIGELMGLNTLRRNFEHSIGSALVRAVESIDAAFNSDGYPGVPTGMFDLDECLGGMHNSDLIVVGARPAIGKTAWMLNVAEKCGVAVGIMSGEQPNEQIAKRLISMNGLVSAQKMRLAKSLEDNDWTRITKATGALMDRPIWINDQPAPTLEQVFRQARKWRHERGIKLFCIDYLQRIKCKAATRREEVGLVAQGLKDLARELDIPILCLAQVNRTVDQRADKMPMMSDLKEAGEIEQEADVVITLYRDDAYNPESEEKGTMRMKICKNRHGPTGDIKLVWRPEFMRVENYERDRGE